MLRVMKRVVRYGLLELLALGGAVAYVPLSNALPSPGPEILAGSILLLIVVALSWRLVQVIKDPVGGRPR